MTDTAPAQTLKLTLDTGEVTIRLRPDLAPGHVQRIKELTRQGFYDGVKFHRVIGGFMAQTGCLVVCGDTGEALGDSIYEARLYVRGEAAGLGADCIEKELREEHVAQVRTLLERAGIDDVDPSSFRRYGSARRLYNFHLDNAGAY